MTLPLRAEADTGTGGPSVASPWPVRLRVQVAFLLLVFGYGVSFSFDENDSFDTAFWMQRGDVRSMLEFRHLIQRLLPWWLWQALGAAGIQVGALALLNAWDFCTGAASVMLLYRILRQLTSSGGISLAASFAYATAHCVWLYTGSGRLYTTSMLLTFAAYYAALQLCAAESERRRWFLVIVSAVSVCFACLFWLVHALNAVGVGLLVVAWPSDVSRLRRVAYLAAYSFAGIVLALSIAVACLLYVQVPLEREAIATWMAAAGTQPTQFDALSLMKASFGQAQGILVMNELPYMISGRMLGDPRLGGLASFPWQLGKFIFTWSLLTLVYVYPLLMWRNAERYRRVLIAVLYVPLAINVLFGLAWLGSDEQRFMPSMLSQFALASLAVQDWLGRLHRPRLLAVPLMLSLAFIAGDNLLEALLPSQRAHIVLAAEMKAVRTYVREQDLLLDFGREFPSSFHPMIQYYAGSRYLPMIGDVATWNWDRRDWKQATHRLMSDVWHRGGRIFAMDRLALGFNPQDAIWSEKQHPSPTASQFGQHLRGNYCVTPAFHLGNFRYYLVEPRGPECPDTVSDSPVARLPLDPRR